MPDFEIASDFQLTGDQPQAVDKLVEGLCEGFPHQTLLGVTGSGKTFTMANVIARLGRPALVMSHNKTLAAQLYAEFKEFFPDNAVEYFVSYYDYYQPEAYVPSKDMYIEKDADINEEIDKLRHAATKALLERRDVIIVASVSCIYGLGEPEEYRSFVLSLEKGKDYPRRDVLRRLVDMQYERNDMEFARGKFRVRGDTLEIQPAYEELGLRFEFFGDTIERIASLDPLTGEILQEMDCVDIFPAKHFVTSHDKLQSAIEGIKAELVERLAVLKEQGKLLEAARLEARTNYDLEMLQETGFCSGVENYSRHLAGRPPGSAPWTLLDYFPKDFVTFIDESHMSIPQIRGMYHGDFARKQTLVDFGFRLPSALDNRPLSFDEFNQRMHQIVYVSATPADYELQVSRQVVEQLVRPTGLLEPTMEVKPTRGQIDDLLDQIKQRTDVGTRAWLPPSPRSWPRSWPITWWRWASRRTICTRRWTPSKGLKSCETSGSESTMSLWVSISCARAWTYRKSLSSLSSTPTRRATCARCRLSSRPWDAQRATLTDTSSCTPTSSPAACSAPWTR